MANNIVGGAPNAIVAKETVSFATAGITALNTEIIYLVGSPLKSFVPGRSINGISGFEANKGYYMVAKVDMDLTSIVVPPVVSLPELSAPGSFTATVISNSQINLSWAAVTNATGYVLQRATNSSFTTGLTTLVNGTNVTSFGDTGLAATTHYYYRVKAVATSGYTDSPYSLDDDTTGASSAHNSQFTGADGTAITAYTPDAGNAWVENNGDWELSGNRATTAGTAPSGNNWVATTDIGTSNQTITVVATKTSNPTVLQVIIAFTDMNNFVVMNWGDGSGNSVHFYNVVAGVATEFGASTAVPAIGSDHTFVVTKSGASLSLTVDSVAAGGGTIPTAQTGTKCGIGSAAVATTGNVLFNSFVTA